MFDKLLSGMSNGTVRYELSINESTIYVNRVSFKQPLFFLFSPVPKLAKTSGIMLNKTGEIEHPCLVLNLREKTLIYN